MLNSVAQWRASEDFEYPVAVAGNRTYVVTLKPPSRATQHVVASVGGVRGDHLVFLDGQGQLAALFLLELVESWEVLPPLDGRP
jgi:hypothetical protein